MTGGEKTPPECEAAGETVIFLCFKCVTRLLTTAHNRHKANAVNDVIKMTRKKYILYTLTANIPPGEKTNQECQQWFVSTSLLRCFPIRKSHSSLELSRLTKD